VRVHQTTVPFEGQLAFGSGSQEMPAYRSRSSDSGELATTENSRTADATRSICGCGRGTKILQIIPVRSLLVLAVKLCLRLALPVLFLFCALQLTKDISNGAEKRI